MAMRQYQRILVLFAFMPLGCNSPNLHPPDQIFGNKKAEGQSIKYFFNFNFAKWQGDSLAPDTCKACWAASFSGDSLQYVASTFGQIEGTEIQFHQTGTSITFRTINPRHDFSGEILCTQDSNGMFFHQSCFRSSILEWISLDSDLNGVLHLIFYKQPHPEEGFQLGYVSHLRREKTKCLEIKIDSPKVIYSRGYASNVDSVFLLTKRLYGDYSGVLLSKQPSTIHFSFEKPVWLGVSCAPIR